jgi:hypothetical protein
LWLEENEADIPCRAKDFESPFFWRPREITWITVVVDESILVTKIKQTSIAMNRMVRHQMEISNDNIQRLTAQVIIARTLRLILYV